MLKAPGELFNRSLEGEALKEWYAFQQTTNQFADTHLAVASSLNYYWYSIGPVALGMSTYAPLNEEELKLFQRFRNVFELAYRRFLDIEKAIAQAKEARIETALERVRAVAMAMRKPEDLSGISETLFTELKALEFNELRNTEIIINNDNKETITSYYYSDYGRTGVVEVDYKTNPTVQDWVNQLRKADDAFAEVVIHEKEMKTWKVYMEEIGYKPDTKLEGVKAIYYYSYSIGLGALSISSFAPIAPEQIKILERFRNVFNLSYQRYADIALAEAQAREAQVQASLERVRATAMAMHKSKDLMDICEIMYKEFLSLGFSEIRNAIINIYNDSDSSFINYDYADAAGKSFIRFTNNILPFVGKIIKDSRGANDAFSETFISGKALAEFKELRQKSGQISDPKLSSAESLYFYFYSIGIGSIGISTFGSIDAEKISLLKRFRNVFQLSYQRYIDITKAEAQSREAQIELALERVRARTMAMQKSEELQDATLVLFQQFTELKESTTQVSICIFDDEVKMGEMYLTLNGEKIDRSFSLELDKEVFIMKKAKKAFLGKQKTFSDTITGTELQVYNHWRNLLIGENRWDESEAALDQSWYVHGAFFSKGMIGLSSGLPPSVETQKLLERFAKVFDGTYTRFLDLQKAEAQVREAQIEAALEKVRSRTMAMQRSDELSGTAAMILEEFKKLEEQDLTQTSIGIYNEEKNEIEFRATDWEGLGGQIDKPAYGSMDEPSLLKPVITAWRAKARSLVMDLTGEAWQGWVNYRNKMTGTTISSKDAGGRRVVSVAFFSKGHISLSSPLPIPAETVKTLERFAAVFDGTFTRFLDLQKAEAQAREATIEAALERVRFHAMAMQNSEDVSTATVTMFNELEKLGVETLRCGILTGDESQFMDVWSVTTANNEKTIKGSGRIDMNTTLLWKLINKSCRQKDDFLFYSMAGEEKNRYYKTISNLPGYSLSETINEMPDQFFQGYFFGEGLIWTFSLHPHSEADKLILKKFTAVFSLTFRRYQDLKQAEAQTREAQIEAGLERVRSRTLAMQKSDELAETAAVVFKQLVGLGIEPNRLYIMLIKDDSGDVEAWVTDEDGTKVANRFTANKNKNASLNKMYEGWAAQKKSLTIDMQGKELDDYLHYLSDILHVPFKAGLSQSRRIQTIAYFSQGLIGIASPDEQPEATTKLLERFAAVFNLTYTRFNDLQISEAQTREAKIETALERVRARALAMQQPEELKEVAEVLRYEMGLLGIEELETCSIYIHDKASVNAECWYALKDVRSKTKKIVSDHFALNLNDTWVGKEMLKFYKSAKKQTSIIMQGANRKEWVNYCEEHSAPFRGYYGDVIPDRTYHLYKFSDGAIGAATPADISEESWSLLKRAASVFSLAYSRFKDLSQARTDLLQLKEEKKKAEDALTELQSTQRQLIQSEKMASLGELTAGIAHEIQNPLNFVNNFSEVSKELLDEMKTEIERGNLDDAKEIMNDIIQNLDKINFHGKRADGIVKGMLQHSRSSSGQKEQTDINALADEYLRLSYHGLRAKDKSFNATFKTDLDPSLEKINIIPQDIGRVILNLLTNAFYVVNEKRKLNIPGYEPTVTVSTKKNGNKIEISVKDNGNGIPQKVLDKIFQPFFTTKPTGQGTGLGLSLSYDIVTKGHGGELKVETKEGEGTTFIIILPA